MSNIKKIITQASQNNSSLLISQFIGQQIQQEKLNCFFESSCLMLLCLFQSRKNLNDYPCYKNLLFTVDQNCSCKILQTLSIMELKQTLRDQLVDCQIALKNYIQSNTIGQFQFQRIENWLQNQNDDAIFKKLQVLLSKIIKQSLLKLRKKENRKHGYDFLSISWKKEAIEHIINKTKKDQDKLTKIKKILQNNSPNTLETKKEMLKQQDCQVNTQNQQINIEKNKFRTLLSKMNCDSYLKAQALKLYNNLAVSLSSKQTQIRKLLECVQQFEGIIPQQMRTIDHLKSEKIELQSYIDLINQQAKQSEIKYKVIQEKLIKLQAQIKELNPVAIHKIKSEQPYYMNPQYEKNQIQQKMLVELIQLESDLLLGKNQIKRLSESVYDIIKTSHYYLQDLSATKYSLIKYDKAIYSIIKDIQSLDNNEIQQILPLKDDSLSFADSYMQQQMKSSFMSNNSDLQGDSKLSRLSRITTQDSLILGSGQDQ